MSVMDTLKHVCYICESGDCKLTGDAPPLPFDMSDLNDAMRAYVTRPTTCRFWLASTPSGKFRVYDFSAVYTKGRPPWSTSFVAEYATQAEAVTTTLIFYKEMRIN